MTRARGKYAKSPIEQDVSNGRRGGRKQEFRSEDFIGSVPLGMGPYTNDRVRGIVRVRLAAKRGKAR